MFLFIDAECSNILYHEASSKSEQCYNYVRFDKDNMHLLKSGIDNFVCA